MSYRIFLFFNYSECTVKVHKPSCIKFLNSFMQNASLRLLYRICNRLTRKSDNQVSSHDLRRLDSKSLPIDSSTVQIQTVNIRIYIYTHLYYIYIYTLLCRQVNIERYIHGMISESYKNLFHKWIEKNVRDLLCPPMISLQNCMKVWIFVNLLFR